MELLMHMTEAEYFALPNNRTTSDIEEWIEKEAGTNRTLFCRMHYEDEGEFIERFHVVIDSCKRP